MLFYVLCLSSLAVAVRPPTITQEITTDREEFSHMIRLCKDPAILGNRLLDEVNQLTSSETAQNKQGKFDLGIRH